MRSRANPVRLALRAFVDVDVNARRTRLEDLQITVALRTKTSRAGICTARLRWTRRTVRGTGLLYGNLRRGLLSTVRPELRSARLNGCRRLLEASRIAVSGAILPRPSALTQEVSQNIRVALSYDSDDRGRLLATYARDPLRVLSRRIRMTIFAL